MPKAVFTQTLVLLLDAPAAQGFIKDALACDELKERPQSDEVWLTGRPSLSLPFRPQVNGCVAIDQFRGSWPDSMGNPNTDPETVEAWAKGYFGPGAYPNMFWEACRLFSDAGQDPSLAKKHAAFITVRSSYVMGGGDDAAYLPSGYEPISELAHLTRIASKLAVLREAICFFNPNGALIAKPSQMVAAVERCDREEAYPVELWCNVRQFKLGESAPGWLLMDTVGMGQLDATDHEACFAASAYKPSEVAGFLWTVVKSVVDQNPVIADGDATDGPGGVRWRAQSWTDSAVWPPRHVVRWLPDDGRFVPAAAQDPTFLKREPASPKAARQSWLRGIIQRSAGRHPKT